MLYIVLWIVGCIYVVKSSIYPPYVDNILDYYPGMEHDRPGCCYECPIGTNKYSIENKNEYMLYREDKINTMRCYVTCLSYMEYVLYVTTNMDKIVLYASYEPCERGTYIRTYNDTILLMVMYLKERYK